ncbi:MAG: citrate transporter [Clostridiales bacterium]|nr:citrate transporter [Clostridiales bacterium]
MRTVINSIKNNAILYISGLLAVISCFFVVPDSGYVSYINFKVLAILFCLMLIVAALVRIGTFDVLTGMLLKRISSHRGISLLLTMLSFFLAMFLTNDVTLVTLVPFAIMVLTPFGRKKEMMYTLIIMTVAANLGSMLTPIGNPQNLYLYERYQIPLPDFIMLMLPYSALSLVIVTVLVFLLIRDGSGSSKPSDQELSVIPKFRCIVYAALFILNVLTVAGYVHFLISLGVTAVLILILDIRSFLKVDYKLLLTFVFFFILIGNIGRIDAITGALAGLVTKYPVPASVLSSQIISNVPAAMLLSAFTENGKALVIGTNLGGLGTIIASMASLITYRFHSAIPKEHKSGSFLLAFTVINIVTLALLFGLFMIMGRS